MKKEYIVLIILIIGLSAYLALKKDGRVHYELPTVPQVDTARIDRIEISKTDQMVVLNKAEKGWTVTDKKFPVTQSDIEQMLGTLKQIKLSALVSQAKDLSRYELDNAHALTVNAFAGTQTLCSVIIGKTAPSYNHTFICLDNKDQTVYQANGNFRAQFDKQSDEFRDKTVLEFDPDGIKKITLEKQGKSIAYTKSEIADTTEQSKDDAPKDVAPEKNASKETVWKTQDGLAADKKTVSDLLSSLSKLECEAFLGDDKSGALKEKQPSCTILLENDKTFVLNLFNKDDNQDVQGSSSYTPWAFTLTGYKAEDIGSYIDKLLGIEQQDGTESAKQ